MSVRGLLGLLGGGVIARCAAWFAVGVPLAARAADPGTLDRPASAALLASGVGGAAVPSLGVGAVLQTLFALVVVIGLVFGCAWLARRVGWQNASRGGALKVVTSVAVGGKERATIVEVGGTWLVLGVAPGNVRLLHTLPAGGGSNGGSGTARGSDPDGMAHAVGASGDAEHGLARGASDPASTPVPVPLAGTFGQRFRDALAGEARKRLMRTPS